MTRILYVDNYRIEEPLVNILYHIRDILNNGKLSSIEEKPDEILVTCPNDDHEGGQEKHPDNHINLKDDGSVPYGIFNCFACQAKGSFVHFVALCFSSSDSYAKSWLIKNYGIPTEGRINLGEPIKLRKQTKKRYLNDTFLDKLQPWHPYLQQRRLDRSVCERFKVKYDPEEKQIVFPIYDVKGNLLMTARRSVQSKIFYMDKDMEKPLYGFNLVQKNDIKAVCWCEGPIDCLSFWSHGIPAIASLGSPTEEQIKQLNRSGVTKLYLACDNDMAGRAFNAFLKKKLSKRILTQEIDYPKSCKDANDLSEDQWQILMEKYDLKRVF